MTGPSALPDGAADAAGGCPPPLAWQEVLREVQQQGEHWTLERPGSVVRGVSIGSGPPVVFLNGLAERRELHFLLAWLLRDQFRCILFDWRGVGSPDASASISLQSLCDDLADMVDHWSGERTALVASGMGGKVALQALLDHPHRFSRLALFGGQGLARLTVAERLLCCCGKLLPVRLGRLPGLRGLLAQQHSRWFPPFDETRFEFLVERISQTPVSALSRLALAVGREDLTARLPQIQQPVLIVQTEGQGKLSRAHVDVLTAGLPKVQVEDMHNSGLIPGLTHPHRVAKLLRAFLEETATASAGTDTSGYSNRSSP